MQVTDSVPIRTLGGFSEAVTISEMKFAVIPIMQIRETTDMPRTITKVAPRAP